MKETGKEKDLKWSKRLSGNSKGERIVSKRGKVTGTDFQERRPDVDERSNVCIIWPSGKRREEKGGNSAFIYRKIRALQRRPFPSEKAFRDD